MFIVFTFLERAPVPKVYPKRVVAPEQKLEQAPAEEEVNFDTLYLHAVMDRLLTRFPQVFEEAVEVMREVKARVAGERLLPGAT